MTLEEINSKYILCDGKIISCELNFVAEQSVIIKIEVREQNNKSLTNVSLKLIFKNISEFSVFEDFDTNNYSDITFVKLETGDFYLSLDPFDNSGQINENDNFVVRAERLEITKL